MNLLERSHFKQNVASYKCMPMPLPYLIVNISMQTTVFYKKKKCNVIWINHTFLSSFKYVKLNLLQSYHVNFTMYDCYICSRSLKAPSEDFTLLTSWLLLHLAITFIVLLFSYTIWQFSMHLMFVVLLCFHKIFKPGLGGGLYLNPL